MAIMKCPKCNGSGKEYVDPSNGGQSTSVAPYTTVCSSCGGKGYVTDKE
jgi:DnaJ-class molecular chaperone